MKKLFAILAAAVLLLCGCTADPKAEKTEVTLFHATDIHYLSPQLTDNSDAFVEMVKSGDGKMTHYSEEITEAFVQQVISAKPDALLISGDISFNCEKLSHEDFIIKLERIEKAGIDVLVLPGNHDLEYPFSRGYEGEYSYRTDYTAEADFLNYYKDFGPDIAYTHSPDGFSYIAQLGKNIYAAVIYTPQSFMNGIAWAEDETLLWLENELAKLDKDAKIVAMTHQNIVNHYPDDAFSLQYTIQNADKLLEIYEKYGVDLNLSGHIHLQHIQQLENGITDIATSGLTVRECQYGVVRIAEDKMFYNTEKTDVQKWAEENGTTDKNLLDFDSYNDSFYFESAYQKAYANVAELKLTEEEKSALAAMWAEFNINYFAGTLNQYYPQLTESEGWQVVQQYNLEENWSFAYMLTALSNGTAENSQLNWEKSF